MKFTIVILPEAKQDLKLAAVWYTKQQKGLGRKFLSQVRQSGKVLQTNPHFAKRHGNIHTLPLRKFPFMIHFLIDEDKNAVTVMAVLHTSQNPGKWPKD